MTYSFITILKNSNDLNELNFFPTQIFTYVEYSSNELYNFACKRQNPQKESIVNVFKIPFAV